MDERSRKTLYIIIWVVIATLLGTIYGSYVTPYKTHLVFGATYMTMNNPFYEVINNELRKEILGTYPKVVQKGYYDYKHKNKDCWIFLPAEIGVYFKFFDEKPFFLDLIPLLDDLDDYKEIDKKRNL